LIYPHGNEVKVMTKRSIRELCYICKYVYHP